MYAKRIDRPVGNPPVQFWDTVAMRAQKPLGSGLGRARRDGTQKYRAARGWDLSIPAVMPYYGAGPVPAVFDSFDPKKPGPIIIDSAHLHYRDPSHNILPRSAGGYNQQEVLMVMQAVLLAGMGGFFLQFIA